MSPKIITSHWKKPIPQRCYDWEAHYDGSEELGTAWYGYGSTEQKAIADLIENCPQPNKG
jgi:hypothetical protein